MKRNPENGKPWTKFAILGVGLSIMAVWGAVYMIQMPGQSHTGQMPALTEREIRIKERLEEHVRILAGEIGERNFWHEEALDRAAQYIEKVLRDAGHSVNLEPYTVKRKPVKNVWVQISGSEAPEEILVVGAHYDSVLGSPGANDNATGTAAVLELARLLVDQRPKRSVRLIAFVNEEPPFYMTEQMGSRVHAAAARKRGERIIGMFSLETIGYYSDEKGSQHYPFPFNFFYPKTGNFIGFVGNLASRDLVRRTIGSFRRHTTFPSEAVAAPGGLTGIGWSDHWSFWKEGYTALMVTDTALFRYDAYHTLLDTPDRIDYERTARVVAGLARVVEDLTGSSL